MNQEKVFQSLRAKLNDYSEISDDTWNQFSSYCQIIKLKKKEALENIGDQSTHWYFLYQGMMRSYVLGGNEEDKEVNKIFFIEGTFPASIRSLLQKKESEFCIEALEDSIVVKIDFAKYRKHLFENIELMKLQIQYLEKHWVIEKEPQEISLLGKDAKERYLEFNAQYPGIIDRVPLHHIASRLGITPTQLSRIRKELK